MKLLKLFRKESALQQRQQEATPSSIELIRELYRDGDYSATINACDQALVIGFNDSELYLTRGLAKYKLGDLPGAGQDMKQAAVLGRK